MASKFTLKCGCVVGETICDVCGCKCSEGNICDGCKYDEDSEDEDVCECCQAKECNCCQLRCSPQGICASCCGCGKRIMPDSVVNDLIAYKAKVAEVTEALNAYKAKSEDDCECCQTGECECCQMECCLDEELCDGHCTCECTCYCGCGRRIFPDVVAEDINVYRARMEEFSSGCKKCKLPLYDMLFNYKPNTFCIC